MYLKIMISIEIAYGIMSTWLIVPSFGTTNCTITFFLVGQEYLTWLLTVYKYPKVKVCLKKSAFDIANHVFPDKLNALQLAQKYQPSYYY